MQIFRHLHKNTQSPLALTIGNFDGLHLGHQMLMHRLREQAQAHGWRTAVMTFEPHPLAVLRNKPARRIAGRSDKMRRLAAANLDVLYIPLFNQSFAARSHLDFATLLFDDLAARYVLVGENFRFGQGRLGDVALLQAVGATYGATIEGAKLFTKDGVAVSSGRIRSCLQAADFDAAATLLGRDWTLRGRVIHGRGMGKKLGFPTANIRLDFMPVCEGIFAAEVLLDGDTWAAALSIGGNPTVSTDGKIKAEAYIVDFDGDLYGRRIEVRPLLKLRDEQTYGDVVQLRAAIADDIKAVREFFKRMPNL